MWPKLACGLALVALASGCATTSFTPYQPKPIENHPNAQTKNGLAIAVHPILGTEENVKHFGDDLPANNIVPVHVIAENRHPSLHFVISRDRILLAAQQFESGSTTPSAPGWKERPSVPTHSGAYPGVFVPIPPGVVLAALALAPFYVASEQRQRNMEAITAQLRAQEFRNRTLAPGQSGSGFVFFQIPKASRLPARWVIRVDGSPAGSEELTRFEFAFSAEREIK